MHSLPLIFIQECKQQLKIMKWYTQIRDIAHFKNLDCNSITLREPCNNPLPRSDIAWLHVTIHVFNRLARKPVV